MDRNVWDSPLFEFTPNGKWVNLPDSLEYQLELFPDPKAPKIERIGHTRLLFDFSELRCAEAINWNLLKISDNFKLKLNSVIMHIEYLERSMKDKICPGVSCLKLSKIKYGYFCGNQPEYISKMGFYLCEECAEIYGKENLVGIKQNEIEQVHQ